MYLGLSWLAKSLALSLTLNGLINYSYSSANLNLFDEMTFENCANIILSRYPFISKKDLREFRKIVQQANYHVVKDFSRLTNIRGIQLLQEKMSDLLTTDDTWKDPREEAYISTVERCYMLLRGNSENKLLKEIYSSSNRYKRSLNSSRSKYLRRRQIYKRPGGTKIRQKRDVASFAFASSSSGGQGSFQNVNSVETAIRNTLNDSSIFKRVFHSGLLQADAEVIAEDITKAGLFGYHAAVINDAVRSVTSSFSFTTINTNSESYAFLLANSIVEVLKRYDLLSQSNGNQIANNIVREIQALLEKKSTHLQAPAPLNIQPSTQGIEARKDSLLFKTSANNQRQNFNPASPIQPSPGNQSPRIQAQTPVNMQQNRQEVEASKESVLVKTSVTNQRQNFNPVLPIQPSQGKKNPDLQPQTPVNIQPSSQEVEGSKDSVLVEASANNQRQNFNPVQPIQPSPVVKSYPEDKIAIFRNKLTSHLADSRELNDLFCKGSSPNVFQTVKSALSDYGLKISVSAAVVATNAFLELNSEQSCSQYANILSEVIRDVLFDNGLLESTNPENIATKIVSSAIKFSNLRLSLQPGTPNENFKSSLPLLPSFPEVTVKPYDEKEFYNSSGIIQKSVLNPSTLPEAKEQNPVSAIKTSPVQQSVAQTDPMSQPAVKVRNNAHDFKLNLKNLLSYSDRFKSVFKPGVFPSEAVNCASRMVRGALSSYGPNIQLAADKQIREVISKLPTESQTTDYSEAFASAVTYILIKNRLLKDADSTYIGNAAVSVFNGMDDSLYKSTENPPLLLEQNNNSSIKPVVQLKQNASSDFVDKNYDATTNLDVLPQTYTKIMPNPSTSEYEFVPTSTMAPPTVTTESIPDFTAANEFVSVFMRAYDIFTAAPDQNSKSFDVVDDPRKLSELLETEMESSARALSQSDTSGAKESDSRSVERIGKIQTNINEPLSEDMNPSVKKVDILVRGAENSSQLESAVRNEPVKLESSFTPAPVVCLNEKTRQEKERKLNILKKVFSISTYGIASIRSPNFNLQGLCNTLNQYAEVLGIDPVPYGNCLEIPLIDYLLHVLKEISSPSKEI